MKGKKKMKKERWKRQLLAVAMAAALVVPQGVYAAEEDVDPNFVAIKDTGTGDAQCINDADLVNSEYVPSLYGGSQEKGGENAIALQGLTITREEGNIETSVELAGQKAKEIYIQAGGNYTISGDWSAEDAQWDAYTFPNAILTVNTTDDVNLTLDNINFTLPEINLQGKKAAGIKCIADAKVNIILKGNNIIDMSARNTYALGSAGIGLEKNANVTISGDGELTVKGGQNHPGIGMLQGQSNGNIVINGGTIHAFGGFQAAGIGGSGASGGTVGKILIEETNGEKIDIYAEGGESSGAGIGSGYGTGFQSIEIKSGTVEATATTVKGSWSNSAGIGGASGDFTVPVLGDIIISGGNIKATGTAYGAGIGGGTKQFPNIIITGGTIEATGMYYGAGIGGGNNAKIGGQTIAITGGEIKAMSGSAEGIGSGAGGTVQNISISGEPQITAYSKSGMAINENATVNDRSILNTKFEDPLPETVNLINDNAVVSLEIPNKNIKSLAYSFDSMESIAQIQDGTTGQDTRFAYFTENEKPNYDFQLTENNMLSKKELKWGTLEKPKFTIEASADVNGFISPSGSISVEKGGNQTFVITSDTGYVIDEVLVDGNTETAAEGKTTYEYTFNNVTASHTIHATFKEKEESGGGSSSSGGSHTSNTYYVRYHNDDDTIKDGRFIPGETVTVRGDIFTAPRGKVLAGWSLEENGKVDYKVGDTFRMPGSSCDLYAVWKDAETMTHTAYISGYPDGTVGPDRTITRAEAATMFYNLLSSKNGTPRTFVDVPMNQWYANAVTTLAGMGVINGYPDGTFKPDAPITRAEFVTMAMNFAKADKGTDCSFADVPENMWYYSAVAGATENGWISGYPDGTFGPDRYITRAEVTSVINRIENRAADMTFIVENLKDMRTFSDLPFQHWAYGSMMEAANGHDYTKEQENTYEVWTEIK